MKKIVRNISIVSFFATAGGWLGIWIDSLTGNTLPPMESLASLIWLTSPALVGILLRAFGGDGWKDSGFGFNLVSGWKWYLLAIFVYPVLALVSAAFALSLGGINIDGFLSQGIQAYGTAAGIAFLASLLKNIFEEFAWRGYLTPRLEAAKVHPILNHLIVGIFWWSWHLPYYFYFLDSATLENSISTSFPVFLSTALVVLFPTSILFGELRLLSKSVWPVYILHNVINGLSMPLLFNEFIKIENTAGMIFTPTNEGVFTSILFGLVGLLLYRHRMKTRETTA